MLMLDPQRYGGVGGHPGGCQTGYGESALLYWRMGAKRRTESKNAVRRLTKFWSHPSCPTRERGPQVPPADPRGLITYAQVAQ
jgi:hypothetical protein